MNVSSGYTVRMRSHSATLDVLPFQSYKAAAGKCCCHVTNVKRFKGEKKTADKCSVLVRNPRMHSGSSGSGRCVRLSSERLYAPIYTALEESETKII